MKNYTQKPLKYQLEVANRLLRNPFERTISKTALRLSHIPGMRKLFCYDLLGGDQKGLLLNIGGHVRSQVGGLVQLAGNVAHDQRNIIGLQSADQIGGSQSQYVGIQSAGYVGEAQTQGMGIQHVNRVQKAQAQLLGLQTSGEVGFDQMQGIGIQMSGTCDGQIQVLGVQISAVSTGQIYHFLTGASVTGSTGRIEHASILPTLGFEDGKVGVFGSL